MIVLQIRNKLVAALVLSFIFMVVEVTGGFIAKRCTFLHCSSDSFSLPCHLHFVSRNH